MADVPVTCMVCQDEHITVDDELTYREQQEALDGWLWAGIGWVGPNCKAKS